MEKLTKKQQKFQVRKQREEEIFKLLEAGRNTIKITEKLEVSGLN